MVTSKTTPEDNFDAVAPQFTQKKGLASYTKILGICIVICIGFALFFYNQSRKLEQGPDKANQEKIMQVVDKVSKLIDLPANEIPTLATVSDATALANQPFFKRAKIGDQVLLYAQARKAFLYDPVANMILEVASVDLNR